MKKILAILTFCLVLAFGIALFPVGVVLRLLATGVLLGWNFTDSIVHGTGLYIASLLVKNKK